MIKECYQKICAGEERRANLILLKQALKEEKNREQLRQLTQNRLDEIMKCLVDGDAKVRKNAAAVLGLMECQEALDVLMDAYEEEPQLFVRAEYVDAVARLDCAPYLGFFKKRLEELRAYDAPENEKKHIRAEIGSIQELLAARGKSGRHTFTGWEEQNEVIFVTLPAFVPALAAQIRGKKTVLKAGVRATVSDLRGAMKIRLFDELLFVVHGGKSRTDDPEEVAQALRQSDLWDILQKNHGGAGPFYVRIGVSSPMPAPEKSAFVKKTAAAVEDAFSGRLVNSASHYEAEIRLIQGKDGAFTPFLRLYTVGDHRFDYRRYHVAASMKPYLAAGLMALAGPYLKEHGQILDPFCGVGTFLMERRFLVPARNAYGIDIFGEAIEKARANSRIAGMQTNYINRDFFAFEHDYPFDEIVTDMPAGNLSGSELELLYGKFFEKSGELLTANGRIICFTRERERMNRQLRLHREFRLIREICIQEKSGASLFIIERRAAGAKEKKDAETEI